MDPFITEVIDKCPGCLCSNILLDYQAVQREKCPTDEGYCFDINLYEKTKFIELRNIDYNKTTELSKLFKVQENTDYKLGLTIENESLILQILPQEKGKLISGTSFFIEVDTPLIGFRDGDLNLLKDKIKTLTVKKSDISQGAIDNSKKVGAIVGNSSKISGATVEIASVASGILGLDPSGIFISFSQTLKMIARFRFLKVNFGKLLGTFLEKTGDTLEPKTSMSRSSILDNQAGSRGKLSAYNKSITTLDLFHYKIAIYILSFLLRILAKFLVKKMKTKGKINKKLFYFVYIHNRVHFIIFNLYLSGCVFLNARSLLHMKYLPNTFFMIFDKYLNIICFFFYWYDIMELLYTSLITEKTAAALDKDYT